MRGRRRRFVSTFRRFSYEKKLSSFMSYVVGLRFKRQGIREIVEVCILTLGHSCSRTYASYPSCVTAYPLGSRSRMFTVHREKLSLPAPGSAARRAQYRKSDPPLPTTRRFPDSRHPCPANPQLAPFAP